MVDPTTPIDAYDRAPRPRSSTRPTVQWPTAAARSTATSSASSGRWSRSTPLGWA